MGCQKCFVNSNDFLGKVCHSFFLIIEIPLLTLHKKVSRCILNFSFSYVPRCFWCEALSTDISLKDIFG